MSRDRNQLQRPSVLTLLATTGTIESLAAMREELRRALAAGEIDPDPKTVGKWEEAVWVRVLELMHRAPRTAPYIFNVTLTWPKPAALAAALDRTVRELTAPLPSEASGLVIEGGKS